MGSGWYCGEVFLGLVYCVVIFSVMRKTNPTLLLLADIKYIMK